MLAQADRFLRVRQHEAEHHLYAEDQRMKIPHDGRLIQQGDSVSRGIAAKGFHALLHEQALLRLHHIIILVENHRGQVAKGNILKLLLYPFIPFSVFPLEAHVDCHRLIAHGHGQSYHHTVVADVPHGLHATLDNIQFASRPYLTANC